MQPPKNNIVETFALFLLDAFKTQPSTKPVLAYLLQLIYDAVKP